MILVSSVFWSALNLNDCPRFSSINSAVDKLIRMFLIGSGKDKTFRICSLKYPSDLDFKKKSTLKGVEYGGELGILLCWFEILLM